MTDRARPRAIARRIEARKGWWHWLFEGGITLKGLMGLTELVAGAALLAAPPTRVHDLIEAAARWHLIADRHGPLSRQLLHAAENWPAASQHFYALYLVLHGGLKLVMVGLLWARFAWAYPAAIAIQCFFIAFEGHRWMHTGNPVLLGLAALDLAIIGLIWHEWRARPQP
ncbi:DUF2127 domain-containing protein [Paracoccus suum]|uniref:DUF2127 domain-containing protein n=1 Tax=Paracoccus suum TaxID=2259340 RepID=A0A344PKE3_9RHOB|nr:DUF2127 domain-containing protein [Paracoccus suum]AXC49848.1 DUF2127 domain-containing protein [Paracoccus suum]